MGCPFKTKIIMYQWFIWKEKYDWGYGILTDWSTKNNSTTDNLALAEEANVDEAVTVESKASNDVEINIKEERKTQAYKKNEHWYWNINTF